MAMGPDGPSSYYSTLGLPPHASASDIRSAYRRLAMQWHPDKFSGGSTEKVELAKRKFQEIQEAYHVLSDEGKRALYDVHMYDPTEGDEDIEGLSSFIREMSSMMAQVKEEDKNRSVEDLQKLFFQTFREDLESWNMSSPTCDGVFGQQAHRLQEDQEPDDDPQGHHHHMKKNRWEVDPSQFAYQNRSRHSHSTVKSGHSHNNSSRDCSNHSKHRKRRGARTPSRAPSMPPVVDVAAATATGSSPATIDNYSYSFMHFFCPPVNDSYTFFQ